MMTYWDTTITLRCTNGVVLAAVLLNVVEMLYSRRDYDNGGMYDWTVLKSGYPLFIRPRFEGLFDVLFGFRGVVANLLLQFALVGLSAALLVRGETTVLPSGGLLVLILANQFRNAYGMDGADQMTVIVLAALFVAGLVPGAILLPKACLWFICLQSTLSYLTAGVYKAVARGWRSGSSLTLIMSTEGYGRPDLSRLLQRHPSLGRNLSWLLIAFECLFFLVLVVGPIGALLFIIGGVVFHLLNATIMGLNNFFWAFTATYPAVWWCSQETWRTLTDAG